MQLTCKDIQAIAHGALFVREEDGAATLSRFTDAQRAYYEQKNPDFFRKAHATSGVRLEFTTDAESVQLSYAERYASSRRYYYFDVFVDGVMVQHFGHSNIAEARSVLTQKLPEGTHEVRIYFPNLAQAQVLKLTLENATFFSPVEKKCRLLCYGDSITQGYDAQYASQSYTNLLADKLGATMVDQAIGGERFCPGLLEEPIGFAPDIVTVAYGTNDWSGRERAKTEQKTNEFFATLRRLYPTAKIFAITPIWRADNHRITKVGTFEEGRQLVRDAATASGITVIEGDGMIPHLPDVCADQYLHPNDFGFKFYANALHAALLPYLEEN